MLLQHKKVKLEESKVENKYLRTKKEKLKEIWEECFGKKLEDNLNAKGVEHFWDDNTTFSEAVELLTCAGIDTLLDVISEVVIIKSGKVNDEKEQCNVKNGKQFKVVRKKDNICFETEFETEIAAKDYIEEVVRHSTYTIDDFMIVKVM